MTEMLNLTHHFLVAMPSLMDPSFRSSVTFLCEHSAEGTMGIIVNRPLELKLSEVFVQMDIETQSEYLQQAPVYYGGPVEVGRGFVLHTPLGKWEATMEVGDGIGVTSSRDILAAMAEDAGPKKAIVALGYSGWAAGQLEQELAQNAWLTCPAKAEILFDTDADSKLAAAAAEIGVDMSLLSGEAGHA